jgi:hypothetical protein
VLGLLLEGLTQGAAGLSLVGIDLEQLPVEFDREVEVPATDRFLGFLELL